MSDLLREAEDLAGRGVKELIFVAQDVTRYGGGADLTELLDGLEKISGFEWIRLMYCYPEMISGRLINKIAGSRRIAKYIDIPFQHVDNGVLRLMNRRTTYESAAELIYAIRRADPSIAVRSTFITGFPGETEEAFEKLCNFISLYNLNNVGFFTYSREEGTPAYSLPDQIPQAVKRRRLKRLSELQREAVRYNNYKTIGKIFRVLYEGIDYERNLFYGRTEYNAPDIDGKVYFKGKFADVGKFYYVRITGVSGYDLKGEIAE
jgi:ribosomal protein S12 methylthiotransferase